MDLGVIMCRMTNLACIQNSAKTTCMDSNISDLVSESFMMHLQRKKTFKHERDCKHEPHSK